MNIIDPIQALTKSMQFKLEKNQHKDCEVMNIGDKGRCWSHCSLFWLLGRLIDEAKELDEALTGIDSPKPTPEQVEAVKMECADVANFAMMIHDNIGNR